MPKFAEYPEMYPNVNGGVAHLLLTILIDMSGSMAPSVQRVRDALKTLEETLQSSDRARTSVEVAIITFGSVVNSTPFMPLKYYECPNVTATGCTCLYEALEMAERLDRERKDFLTSQGTGHYTSWMMIFCDGMPTDKDNGQVKRLLDAQKRGSVIVYPVHIWDDEDADSRKKKEAERVLAALSVDGSLITATRENFENAMVWLSGSVVKVSDSNPGEEVLLDNPNDPKYGGIRFKQIPVRA